MKDLEKLVKLIKLLDHRGPILTGREALAFYSKDKPKDHHGVFLHEGKFTYWSAQESHHNGDYYGETNADLTTTPELVAACIAKLTTEAVNRIQDELRTEEHSQRKRKAENLLNERLGA